MRILGIDPGLRLTGYGLVEGAPDGPTVIDAGLIRTDGTQSLPTRLHELHAGLTDIVGDGHPHLLAIEDIFAHPGFPRTAIVMGHVCGVICLAAAQAGVPIDTIPPASVKRAMITSGRAGKRQMQRMVRILLEMAEDPGTHVADALAVALVALSRRGQSLGRPLAVRGSA
ncbi:MAG TPA: crossover junction endodeoxyribonuclease RuvC [bacterium]|nr:crossover junction endodeoxyribonuclease RuvC [bacterium]